MEFQAGRISVTLGGAQVGRTWADPARSRRLPGYPAVTLKCTAPLRDRARVFLLVENLLDRQYEVISGYPMPGFALTGGLQLRF
jgi:outer membrane cobalamin receptor